MQVTYDEFNALVLAAIGAPITRNNLNKLNAIAVQEGKHGTFNPMNWVLNAPGSTNYNSVGVKNYPDLLIGVSTTAAGLTQSNTKAMRENLTKDAGYADFLKATSSFYQTWGGGNLIISGQQAEKAGGTLLEGVTDQATVDLAKNQVQADHKGANELDIGDIFAKGIAVADNPGGTALDTIESGLGIDIPNPFESISNTTDFLKLIGSGLTNKNTWIRVGMFLGGFVLVIMGLWLLAEHVGGVPGPGETAHTAVKAAGTAAVA